jgi:hypothetical protein
MKTFIIVPILLLGWLTWLLTSQFLLCARYQFEEPTPFEGNTIYNPYKSIKADDWRKCNFHAHAKAWNGLTNGHGTAKDIHRAYRSLRYDVHCVSNYHHIDTTNSKDPGYIPVYEHGYNISKTHQLVLGSKNIQWLDYLFPQTLHNKQHVLDNLNESGSVVILNHPALRTGYTSRDLSQLTGYDCMEVLNPSVISTEQWDAALSAGKKVFIVGDDDIHDVISKERLGEMCTFVNVSENSGSQIMNALKTGQSYGVQIGKTQQLDDIPKLKTLDTKGDSIFIVMSHSAAQVTITGQNGDTLASFSETSKVKYKLRPVDHYARATFEYGNGTTVYLNPIFFVPESGYQDHVVYENVNETRFFRTLGVVILFLSLLLIWTFLSGNGRQPYGRRKLSLR